MEILRANFGAEAKIKIAPKQAEPKTDDQNESNSDESDITRARQDMEQNSSSNLAGPSQESQSNFKPYLGDKRDNTEDFTTAYSLKFQTDSGIVVDDMALLDMELEKIEEQSKDTSKPSEIPEVKVKIDDSTMLKPESSESKSPEELQNAKNQAILKEAHRLFGEPEILNLS